VIDVSNTKNAIKANADYQIVAMATVKGERRKTLI